MTQLWMRHEPCIVSIILGASGSSVTGPAPLPGSSVTDGDAEAGAGDVATEPLLVTDPIGTTSTASPLIASDEAVCYDDAVSCASSDDEPCSADLTSEAPSTVSSIPKTRFSCCRIRSTYAPAPPRPIKNATVPNKVALSDRGCFLMVNTWGPPRYVTRNTILLMLISVSDKCHKR